ncbi:uncharacterized protein VDAG_08043 [Verticillium dahliae VdLs.17]|uniref:SRR1-like domain-containing protein n=1 Tax=Verticillium dahliae (strain VdLs.17 / ATCC MYA-4575 / FGSC 10137) TaxID=498257 RepID=G2XD11_VERDV|nr:uncharacterized protein VDAG_08043 [Verticillium dahliae VdLs.17]EGY16879.1 hypothetical protein VDAG_08043 [Verticillium dahliae VdLs.17]KAH6706747.1 hypothetical protein EV126DRAFT_333203 [Verticillium dahliae]
MALEITTLNPGEPEPWPSFDHPSSQGIRSSQRAANLYDKGIKFYRKEDLVNIEKEVSESYIREFFNLPRIDGTVLRMRNPLHGVLKPIWSPIIEFQNYWKFVRKEPDGPPETHLCSFRVDWLNQSMQQYEGNIENYEGIFRGKRTAWVDSKTCAAFKAHTRQLLAKRKVTKIVCFGLGDFVRRPPVWWKIRNAQSDNPITEGDHLEGAEARAILEDVGFEVVGAFGAGGFAEIDEETVVISIYTAVPVKQIVADMPRPISIITTPPGEILNSSERIPADTETPRTREMWRQYVASDFPAVADDISSITSLGSLKIFTRIEDAVS